MMKFLCATVVAASLSACVAVVPVPITAPAAAVPVDTTPVASTASFTTRINAFRAGQGVGPLRQSAVLTRAAQGHADDMLARGYFAHESAGGPNGDNLMQRAQAAGCSVRAVAENIAQGQPGEADVINGWANSAGHRRNMLNSRMTDYGLGRAGDLWVLVLSSGC